MRVLGIDPGLTRCGIGVVDSSGARRVQFVAAGVIRTPATNTVDLRLLGIAQGIEQWLAEFTPDVVAVERVFAQHNLHTVMGTAQAAGIAIVAAARRNIPVAWHTPSEVKAAVTGSGRADKPQVQFMVQRILHLAEAPQPADAADALALAITHIWRPSIVPPQISLRDDADATNSAAAHSRPRPATQKPRTTAKQQWQAAEAKAKNGKLRGKSTN